MYNDLCWDSLFGPFYPQTLFSLEYKELNRDFSWLDGNREDDNSAKTIDEAHLSESSEKI